MATVRIYKVAEVLNTSSQEVIEWLKRDHGIEVKSASSTIEEVVARQFAERLARKLDVTLPSGPMFADTPAAKTKGRKAPASKRPEPAKPAAPALPPPRLVKTVRPPPPPEPEPAPVDTEPEQEPLPAEVASAAPADEELPTPAPGEPVPPMAGPPPPGRLIPSKLRLRVEDLRVIPSPSPSPPTTPPRPPVPPPRAVQPAAPPAPPARPKPTTRPIAPPGSVGVGVPSRPPIGGPRPLPSQPVRTPTPPRPGTVPPRPTPSYRPRPPGGAGRTATAQRRAARRKPRPTAPPPPAAPPPITRTITLAEGMTVKDLADKVGERAKDVLKKLLDKRLMMTINTILDTDTATMVAREFGADVEMRTFEEEVLQAEAEGVSPGDLIPRAPVVTVMGHVDHGKTTLLDAIRETQVAEREAGGITQHIGAYTVPVNDRKVVFLDTPGHEAFTMMRARGARVTDVVVLVVAADDGVMPQTKEAIDHSRAAGVPIIVAINKIDKPDANPDRVKTELADLGLTPEQWGGQTVTVETSAKKKQNLELLLEMILLVTELGELKANPRRSAAGTVLEAKLDRGRGPVATILVQNGTLHVGDTFIAGTIVGRVRALIDDHGHQAKSAGPASPVEVLGLTGVPQPGDAFQALDDATKARQVALFRQAQAKERALGVKGSRLTLASLQQQIAEGVVKELPIIVKADVQGSAEVLAETLTKLGDERVKTRIIHSGAGAINESDVLLASASNAVIIGFNVRPDRNASDVAERERVEIRQHSVIYNVTDEVRKAMAGLLEPTVKEARLGIAEVRQTFKVPKFGTAAGCAVVEGRITRSGDVQVRLLRDNVVIHEGRIGSLRRFKDDVSEVKAGLECGIAFERFSDIKIGDVIEVFTVERVAATV